MSLSCWAIAQARPSSSVIRHSIPSDMSSSRPAAFRRGPSAKPRSNGEALRASRPATRNSAATPACMRPARMRLMPCATRMRLLASSLTTSATVPSATRSSRLSSLGWVCGVEHAAPAQFGAQRQQHVEHDADAGQVLAGEAAVRLVRVDDHARVRQRVARQVVVGDDHFDAAPVGFDHAVDAGDAVVDGDDDVGRLFARGQRDDLGRQAVAVLEAVGHDVVDLRAHRAQAAQRRPRRRWRRRSRSRRR